MNKKIIACIFLMLFFFCQQSFADVMDDFRSTKKSIDVVLMKKDIKFTVMGMTTSPRDIESGYFLTNVYLNKMHYGKIISSSGKVIGYFPASEMVLIICRDGFGDLDGCRELPEGEIYIRIPYSPEGKKVEFFDQKGKKILTIDISSVGKK